VTYSRLLAVTIRVRRSCSPATGIPVSQSPEETVLMGAVKYKAFLYAGGFRALTDYYFDPALRWWRGLLRILALGRRRWTWCSRHSPAYRSGFVPARSRSLLAVVRLKSEPSMTHDQVCAIKAVQGAVASARKVGATAAEIQQAISGPESSRTRQEIESDGEAQIESRPSIKDLPLLAGKTEEQPLF
jgi:hypothetical protein